MAYPVIHLDEPIAFRPKVEVDSLLVLAVEEVPGAGVVRAHVCFGPYVSGHRRNTQWVNVLSGDDFYAEWTDEDVIDQIKAWVAEQAWPELQPVEEFLGPDGAV